MQSRNRKTTEVTIIPEKCQRKKKQYSYGNNNGSIKHTWNKIKAKTP